MDETSDEHCLATLSRISRRGIRLRAKVDLVLAGKGGGRHLCSAAREKISTQRQETAVIELTFARNLHGTSRPGPSDEFSFYIDDV